MLFLQILSGDKHCKTRAEFYAVEESNKSRKKKIRDLIFQNFE